jgi:uncharacterized cofD-like protein
MARVLPHVIGKRVVTIGGGTGPFALLSWLKRYPCSITAVVSMVDSGGSSRRLMDEFGQLPFGDLRQALVALSRKGLLWRDVFGFRFHNGQHTDSVRAGLNGHSLGNLIISALQEIEEGNLLQALADAEELLDTAGKVLPVTLSHATLCALLEDGALVRGETEIDTRGAECRGPLPAIDRVFLEPDISASAEAIHAIQHADIIIIGPGDLYTSILPTLLVHGIVEAIRECKATTVYVCNLMTKHGETDGFHASDYVRELLRYLRGPLDRVILHDGTLPPTLLDVYATQGQYPVVPDTESIRKVVADVVVDNMLTIHPDRHIRHDADRLIRSIFERDVDAAAHASYRPVRRSRSS